MVPAIVDSEDEDAEIIVPDNRDTHRELSSFTYERAGFGFDGSDDRTEISTST